jgi:hypothetical protein
VKQTGVAFALLAAKGPKASKYMGFSYGIQLSDLQLVGRTLNMVRYLISGIIASPLSLLANCEQCFQTGYPHAFPNHCLLSVRSNVPVSFGAT